MIVKEWAAIHRKHHSKVDTVDDPHSPITRGKLRVLLMGVWFYVQEALNKETVKVYGHNTPHDWIERNLYTKHKMLGVGFLLGIINVTLFGLPGLIIWGIQAMWIPLWAAGVINGAGHFFGYQNFKRGDPRYPNVAFSTNISPVGIWIGGEELHNNHHAFPTSPFFAKKWYEFDVGGVIIKILCLLRLARLRTPLVPKNTFQAGYYRFFNLR
jgi:stearoyl-CoA desaturase (delta-9 desaturase)